MTASGHLLPCRRGVGTVRCAPDSGPALRSLDRRNCANSGRSQGRAGTGGIDDSGHSPTLATCSDRQPVVARASQGMIRAGDIGPDEVRT